MRKSIIWPAKSPHRRESTAATHSGGEPVVFWAAENKGKMAASAVKMAKKDFDEIIFYISRVRGIRSGTALRDDDERAAREDGEESPPGVVGTISHFILMIE